MLGRVFWGFWGQLQAWRQSEIVIEVNMNWIKTRRIKEGVKLLMGECGYAKNGILLQIYCLKIKV